MKDNQKNKENEKKDLKNTRPAACLSEEDMDKVTGGFDASYIKIEIMEKS